MTILFVVLISLCFIWYVYYDTKKSEIKHKQRIKKIQEDHEKAIKQLEEKYPKWQTGQFLLCKVNQEEKPKLYFVNDLNIKGLLVYDTTLMMCYRSNFIELYGMERNENVYIPSYTSHMNENETHHIFSNNSICKYIGKDVRTDEKTFQHTINELCIVEVLK